MCSNYDTSHVPVLYPTPETPETKKTFGRLGLAVLLLTVGMTVMEVVVGALLLQFGPEVATAWWADWVISFVPLYGVGLPVLFLMIQRVPVAPHNRTYTDGLLTLEKPRFTLVNWLVVFGICFGCMFAGSIVGNNVMDMLTALTGYNYGNSLTSLMDDTPLWVTFVGACILGPLGEEFIFRKLFIDRARRYGDVPAILISGVLFGLFHCNLYQLFYATALGILLAYVYTRTGNIWPCVGLHAAINLLGGILLPAVASLIDMEAVETPSLSAGFMASLVLLLALAAFEYGMIALAVFLGVTRHKRRVLSDSPDGRPVRFVMRDALSAPGLLAAGGAFILLIVLGLVLPVLQMILMSFYQSV